MGPTPTIEARRAAASLLLAGLGDAVVSVGNDDLGPFLREVDDLSRQMEAARDNRLTIGGWPPGARRPAGGGGTPADLHQGVAAALVTVHRAIRVGCWGGLARSLNE
jgi:hypothetical protein